MRNKQLKNDLSKFKIDKTIIDSLTKTKNDYRVFDPGSYLYRKLFESPSKLDENYLELVYVTLCSWNMNSRGAKLQEFNLFKKSILNYSRELNYLKKLSINNWNNEISQKVEVLFMNLNLVAEGKPLLVTFSKTMHFLLPNLIVPIDRKYTLNYFFENTYVPKSKASQYQIINTIQSEFSNFSRCVNLKIYLDETWNLCETKIMDNMIIGFQKT